MKFGVSLPAQFDEAGTRRIIAAFANSAQRAARAGFDLVEVHAAHGYLIHGFISPITNHRTDAWGGLTEKRNRFALDIARAVRKVWPRDRAFDRPKSVAPWDRPNVV